MSKKKIVAVIVSLGLIAAIGIGATLAYLTATTGTLENTFTVGNVKMSIWENDNTNDDVDTKYAEDGFKGNNYNLLPNQTEDKAPFVQVDERDVEVYVYAKIDGLAELAAKKITIDGINTTDWVLVEADGDKGDGIYRYKTTVTVGNTEEDIYDEAANVALASAKLFTEVTYAEDATGGDGTTLLETLTIKGACVQAAENTQANADTIAIGLLNPTVEP